MKYILRRYSKELTIFVQGEYWEEDHTISKQGASSFKNRSLELLFFKKGEKSHRYGGWYDYEYENKHRLTKIELSVRELARNIPSTNWFFWKKLLQTINEINKDHQNKIKAILEEGQILGFSRALGK
jgi:hypothetical protein